MRWSGASHFERRTGMAFAAFVAVALLAGCTRPTHDQQVLKAIKAEAQTLMAAPPPGPFESLPKYRWPRAIASLEPEFVNVRDDGVDIVTKPYFDGGYGYYIAKYEDEAPEPAGRYERL